MISSHPLIGNYYKRTKRSSLFLYHSHVPFAFIASTYFKISNSFNPQLNPSFLKTQHPTTRCMCHIYPWLSSPCSEPQFKSPRTSPAFNRPRSLPTPARTRPIVTRSITGSVPAARCLKSSPSKMSRTSAPHRSSPLTTTVYGPAQT